MTGGDTKQGSLDITSSPEAHLVFVRFDPGTSLTGADGDAIVAALTRVLGTAGEPFGLLADTKGVTSTDASYRAATGAFFRQHRDDARIALFNLSPLIRVVAEMFRVGIGIQMRTFAGEDPAREWLRKQGIRA